MSSPRWAAFSPLATKGTPVTMHLYVEDADKQFQQALAAGAEVAMPMADQFWGDRYGIVKDPSGHHWSIAQPHGRPDPGADQGADGKGIRPISAVPCPRNAVATVPAT